MTPAKGVHRFGICQEKAERLRAEMRPLIARMPAVCTLHQDKDILATFDFGSHLLDWEAELLRQVFDHFKDVNPDVCVLLAYLVSESEIADGQDYIFKRLTYVEKRTKKESDSMPSV